MTPTIERPPAALTAGIPTTDAPNPFETELNRPWEEEQEKQRRQQAQWQVDHTRKLDKALLDPESISFDFSRSQNPEETRKRALVSSYLQIANNGQPIPGGHLGQTIHRDRLAQSLFKGAGKGDDLAFYDQITGEAQQREEKRKLGKELTEQANLNAIVRITDPGKAKESSWGTFRDKARKSAGYTPEDETELYIAYQDRLSETNSSLSAFAPELKELSKAIKSGPGGNFTQIVQAAGSELLLGDQGALYAETQKKDAPKLAAELYYTLTPEERPQLMTALRAWAQALPKEEKAAFFANLSKQAGRDIDDLVRNIGSTPGTIEAAEEADRRRAVFASRQDENPVARFLKGGEGGGLLGALDPTGEMADKQAEGIKQLYAARNFASDIRNIEREDYNPMKSAWGDDEIGILERGLYGVPGALASSAMAAVPYVGFAAMYSSMEGSAYDDIRQNLLASGMADEEATATASQWKSIAAVPQAALEKLGSVAIGGKLPSDILFEKLPFFRKYLNYVGNKFTSNTARVGMRTTVGGVQETTIDTVQNYIPHFIQDAAHALDQDMPDVTWSNGKDGALDGFWSQAATTFVTMLPLAIIGAAGGISTDQRVTAFQNASDNALLALGASPEQLAEIRAAQAEGKSSLAQKLPAILQSLDPNLDTARVALEALVAEELKKQGIVEEAQQSGILPRFTRTNEGWTLHDTETGEEIGFAKNAAGAMHIAATHSNAIDEQDADRFAYLTTMLEAGDLSAASDTPYRHTTTVIRTDQTVTTTQQAATSPEDAAKVASEMRVRELTEGGDGTITEGILGEPIVAGESRTTFENNQRRTVNRLNAGASVLTVFHEETHGFLRVALKTGRLTQASTLTFLRAVDTVLTGKQTKEATAQLRLIPENFAELSAEDQATAIDEAVSELMESEVIRTRKGTGTRKLPPRLISRNLAAISRLAAGPTSQFRAFARALRSFFGIAIDRAAHIDKGLKDGTLDQSEYATFLAKITGQQEQDAYDQQVRDHEQDLIEGIASPESILDGDPFSINPTSPSYSLAPAAMADAIRGNTIARIRDPEQRARRLSNIARKLESIQLVKERLELIQGSKRKKSSLTKEAAFREADLAEQYENEAYARHYGILEDDDLRKIKSQPLHKLFSDPDSPLHGSLMSKSKAIKNHPDLFRLHRAGDYDGSDGVSRSIFGGTRMPDQAAQDAFDAGIIKSPTADALWQGLLKEQAMVASMKELHQAAKEDIRNARNRAKQETNEWLSLQLGKQEANFSPKQQVLDALALYDAILSSVSPEIRGKVGGYTQLAKLGTDESRLAFLSARLEKVDSLLEQELRTQFNREMQELLTRARPKKNAPGEKPKGTAGSDIHDLFREVEFYMGQPMEQAEAEAAKLESLVASGTLTPEQESHNTLLANLLRLSADWTKADAARRGEAVAEATRLFAKGYIVHRVIVSAKAEARQKRRAGTRKQTGKPGNPDIIKANREKQGSSKADIGKSSLVNYFAFSQILGTLTGDNSETMIYFGDWERRADEAKTDALHAKATAINDMLADLGEGGSFAAAEMQRKLQAAGTVTVKTKPQNYRFSMMEAISATLMWQQEDGRRHMEGHLDDAGNQIGEWAWTEADIESLESQLTPEAKAVRLHLMEQYAAEYDRLNPVFRDQNGINLPRNKKYSPLTVTPQQLSEGQVLDPVTGFAMSPGFSPGSLRNRSQTAIAQPDFRDALSTYIAHGQQIEHYIAYAAFNAEASAVFRDRETRAAMEERGGSEAMKNLDLWLEAFGIGGIRLSGAHLANQKFIGGFAQNATSMALIGRITVPIVQSLQLFASLSQMSPASYLKRVGKAFIGQLDIRAALDTPYMRRRLNQQPPAVRDAVNHLLTSSKGRWEDSAIASPIYKSSRFFKHFMAKSGGVIPWADYRFTAISYAIIYDKELTEIRKDPANKGTPAADLEALATANTERTMDTYIAQPMRLGARSFVELQNQTGAMRTMFNFVSEPRQKYAGAAYKTREAIKNGDGSARKAAARMWVTYYLIAGTALTILRATMQDARRDEEDDEWIWNPKTLALNIALGPLTIVPILGDELASTIQIAFGDRPFEGTLLSSIRRAPSAGAGILDIFQGESDPEQAIKDIEALLTAVGLYSDTAAAGASFMHLVRDLFGIADNITGD